MSAEKRRDMWFVGIMFSIAVIGYAIAFVMFLTGYMPASGFGHSPVHAARFCLDAGVSSMCLFAISIFGMTR